MNKKNNLIQTLVLGTTLMLSTACNQHNQKQNNSSTEPMEISLDEKNFKKTIDGKETSLFTLVNQSGVKAFITNYGGRLVSLYVPDAKGKLTDVVAGYSTIDGFQQSKEPYFGATVGRVGNRIAKGKFMLDGKAYTLFTNYGPNTLHGGKKGYQDVVWDAKQLDEQRLELHYLSKDMEEGFPGNLDIKVVYELLDDNALKISYKATTDKNTVVNLTNHAFFNLNGEASGSILNHTLHIDADQFTPVDATLIPTGKIESVKGTPLDFTTPEKIGARIDDKHQQLLFGAGYDHNYVLNTKDLSATAATVTGDQTGIIMEVYTDQPGLQFYSGNFMKSKNEMKNNHKDDFRTAFALETQHFPDAPNQPNFPSITLKPSEVYQTETIYKFKTKK